MRSDTSVYFHSCSILVEQLGRLLLEVPLTVLQNAIGKSGPSGIPPAMSSLLLNATVSPRATIEAALMSLKMIHKLTPRRPGSPPSNEAYNEIDGEDTGPFGIVTLFISHMVLWAFMSVARQAQKIELMRMAESDEALKEAAILIVIKRIIGPVTEPVPSPPQSIGSYANAISGASPMLVFRNAADVLTRMGTWGASLNMALLLHFRATME
jgi:hypothetical protein